MATGLRMSGWLSYTAGQVEKKVNFRMSAKILATVGLKVPTSLEMQVRGME